MNSTTGLPKQVTLSAAAIAEIRVETMALIEDMSPEMDPARVAWAMAANAETAGRLAALEAIEQGGGTVIDPDVLADIHEVVTTHAQALSRSGCEGDTASSLRAWGELEDTFGVDRRQVAIEWAEANEPAKARS